MKGENPYGAVDLKPSEDPPRHQSDKPRFAVNPRFQCMHMTPEKGRSPLQCAYEPVDRQSRFCKRHMPHN